MNFGQFGNQYDIVVVVTPAEALHILAPYYLLMLRQNRRVKNEKKIRKRKKNHKINSRKLKSRMHAFMRRFAAACY